jgi:hypothetical protein
MPRITADDVKAIYEQQGISTEGLDLEKIAAVHNDPNVPQGWEPPRVLPANWIEVMRLADGAKYTSPNQKLAAILSCGYESDQRAWLHLSVSHRDRIPTWGEFRTTKELFLGDREAIQVLPPKAKYVNLHPNVLHAFALLDINEKIGLPDFTGGTGSI